MYFKEMNVIVVLVIICLVGGGGDRKIQVVEGEEAHRILLDTDVDTDDFFALLYLLKLNRSQIHLQGITISANAWLDAGHAVNQIYDILYMMGRDDIAVGVGGEGGILDDGTILSDVGGYLPLIEQGIGTAGHCRYRQAIPVGIGGRLDLDTNFGFRKSFLPQGKRKYTPLRQPTAQQVMVNIISTGPTNVFLTGSATNFGIFLMKNPQLKINVKHVYIMGGGLNSKNPTGCCPKNETFSCQPRQCGDPGNLFSDYTSNPYAEFNMFCDPFAAYQVIHSGIPITLVPLDATNTIPITPDFFKDFENNQHTFEAQYCFKSLKMVRDTWFDEHFYTSYFMWDSFMSGVAISIMLNPRSLKGENEFAEMEYMNITVITSNEPYGISDGSNPFFDKLRVPKFNLTNRCVHSGHVQTSLRDPFCQAKNGKGICQDGYTKEVIGQDGVPVLVAVRAKPNIDTKSSLNRDFFSSFLKFINLPNQAGRFNVTTQFPYYKEVFYKPDFTGKNFGKNVVFDMDMSAGDFVSLFYLLKLPSDIINLLAVVITPTGWANAATIDVVYDVLHMMGRDDIPVGLGEVFAMNESDPIFPLVGGCKYNRAIPHGSGGFLDSDTLYGLARDLPRSPRRYTAENLMKYGAPRDTENPNLRQQLAMEVWESVVKRVGPESKVSILTNGPLTTLATIITSGENLTSCIEDILIVGGHINYNNKSEKGNVINIPSNEYAEMNMFLDPLAANTVFSSEFNITLLPLNIQRSVSHFETILMKLDSTNKTPEAMFTRRLLSRLNRLKLKHFRYHHMDTFLGEILGGVILGGDHTILKPTFEEKRIKISTTGTESEDGTMTVDEKEGKPVKLLTSLNTEAYFNLFAFQLSSKNQSAVVGSFKYQTRLWSVHST